MADGMNALRDLANLTLQVLPTSRFFGLKRLVLGWAGVEVGPRARVNGRCWFYGRGRVRIGADTWVGPGCTFHTSTGAVIDLGSRCDVAPEVSFINGTHAAGAHARRAGAEAAGDIRIGDGCWIGARTTVLGGVTIGAGSVVAAGALVRLQLPGGQLACGRPGGPQEGTAAWVRPARGSCTSATPLGKTSAANGVSRPTRRPRPRRSSVWCQRSARQAWTPGSSVSGAGVRAARGGGTAPGRPVLTGCRSRMPHSSTPRFSPTRSACSRQGCSRCVLLRPAGAAVFYNPSPHYLGALAVARIRRARRVLDLEDGPRPDQRGFRARTGSWLLRAYLALCPGGVIAASTALLEAAPRSPGMVVYGVAPDVATARSWEPPLTFLLSGSLLEDTGTGLFLEALDVLERTRPDLVPRSRFVVTGFGDQARPRREGSGIPPRRVVAFPRAAPGTSSTRSSLEACHCGLCLKLPDRSMGATTFPSKVVEMAAHGLLVLSTRVSDVPLLFDDSSAELLSEASPAALASAFARVIEDPGGARHRADRGLAMIRGRLSAEIAGHQLRAFLVPAKFDRESPATSRSADHL